VLRLFQWLDEPRTISMHLPLRYCLASIETQLCELSLDRLHQLFQKGWQHLHLEGLDADLVIFADLEPIKGLEVSSETLKVGLPPSASTGVVPAASA
jgi:hypothetical protein